MARTTDAGNEAGISVTMDGDRVVIRPSGHLDGDAIDTLDALLRGATAAGVAAVVDLEAVDRGDRPAVLAALAEHVGAHHTALATTPG